MRIVITLVIIIFHTGSNKSIYRGTLYVNGKKISTGNDYRQITINAHDEIAIVYGKPPASIPSNYEFPEGMRSQSTDLQYEYDQKGFYLYKVN